MPTTTPANGATRRDLDHANQLLAAAAPRLAWSHSAPRGGAHRSTVFHGRGDADIALLVLSSSGDGRLLGDLPWLLAGLLEHHGRPLSDELRAQARGERANPHVPDLAQVRNRLAASSPGPWTLAGSARLELVEGELELSGRLQLLAGSVHVGDLTPWDATDLACAQLMGSGVDLARRLAGAA